jgi:hypothetical protein
MFLGLVDSRFSSLFLTKRNENFFSSLFVFFWDSFFSFFSTWRPDPTTAARPSAADDRIRPPAGHSREGVCVAGRAKDRHRAIDTVTGPGPGVTARSRSDGP